MFNLSVHIFIKLLAQDQYGKGLIKVADNELFDSLSFVLVMAALN